ncbi:MAG: Verru_Chthon cassette protein A, partial [Verrucomicrobiae bacterium]
MALVLVLSTLVLLSILVVSILQSARQEVTSSNSYGAGSDVKMLADVPLSLVTAQIAQATSDPDHAWISQPGLLRTFSSSGPLKAFKLYSSYNMEVSGAYNPEAELSSEVPADWNSKPNEFVDLNRPVQLGNRMIYPIADPNATALVQGFSYNGTAVTPSSGTASANALPMPVRWIYLTANGSLLKADDFKDAVARVAFWTDDETSKVNINTACGGVFFDTPCTNTREDHMLGRTQPIAQEYQRWPGHPATTSLAPVLKPLRDIADPVLRSQVAASLTPRISWGGSAGGTKYAWLTRELGATDMDRLYATPDELSFGNGVDSAGLRIPNTANGTSLEKDDQKLDELRFFLTTQSRAPELNLFNRPRISLWPFNEEMVQTTVDARLTPEDRLIRFASELGGVKTDGSLDYSKRKRFYFQRRSAWDPAADWNIPANRAIFRYLQKMTSRPLPSANTARAGSATFVSDSKFGQANRDSILTCMWDYLRSGVNTVNQAYVPAGFLPYSFPQKYYNTKNSTYEAHDTTITGFNDVAPLVISDLGTKGLGRHPVLTEIIFQFVNMGDDFEKDASGKRIDQHKNSIPTDMTKDDVPDYVIRKVRMVALLNFQMPISSLHGSLPRLQVKITGSTPFSFTTLLTPAPSPLMNGGLTQPLQVRNYTMGGNSTSWLDALGSAGIGFPAPSSGSGFRDTNYIGSFSNGWGYDTRAGLLGPGFGMFAVIENKTGIDNSKADAAKLHRLKVLSNRTSTMEPADATWLNSSTTSWTAREDVYYPFVSDVIEFRLPQRGLSYNIPKGSSPPNVPPPSTAPIVPSPGLDNVVLDPVNQEAKITPATSTMNGTDGIVDASVGKDYFEAYLSGGTLDVAIYPGLQDTAKALSPVSDNWQAQTGSNGTVNYLMHTTINVDNTIIPLPRPGGNSSYSSTTLLAMGNYYERANYVKSGRCDSDALLLVPCTAQTSGNRTQMDVFRSYLLQGGTPVNGDLRLAALRTEIPSTWWQPHPLYSTRGVFHGTSFFPGQQQEADAIDPPVPYDKNDPLAGNGEKKVLCAVDGNSTSTTAWDAREKSGRLHSSISLYNSSASRAASPAATASARYGSAGLGDFSQGLGNLSAGAVVSGPDLGGVSWEQNVPTNLTTTGPYFSGEVSRTGKDDSATTSGGASGKNLTGIMYSPFKQAPSPVIFGTIPSRAGGNPTDVGSWETLLFCPNPAGGKAKHRGWNDAPRDHYLLDLFYMPVVEPYAIT